MFRTSFLNSIFLRNVLKVSTGTFLAQILMLIGMPIITRLYNKEQIGIYALFISTIGITSSFVTLAYDTTIVLPKKNKDAYALFKIAFFSSVLFSILIGLILNLPFDFFIQYKSIALFLVIGTTIQVLVNSLGYFKIRNNKYGQLSKSKLIRNLSLLSFQVLLFYLTPNGLHIGFITAAVITTIYLIYDDANIRLALFGRQKLSFLLNNLREYKEYPKYFCWSNLIIALSAGVPVILFNEHFSLTQVALYSIAFSLIVQPASLIASSVRPVLLSKFSQNKNLKNSIISMYDKVFYILFVGSMVISLFIYFCFPFLVTFIFGNNWEDSGLLTRYLIPIFIWYFISIPSSISLKVYPFQKHSFYYTILSFLITIGGMFFTISINLSFFNVVLIFSFTSLFMSFLNHYIVREKIVKYENTIFNI